MSREGLKGGLVGLVIIVGAAIILVNFFVTRQINAIKEVNPAKKKSMVNKKDIPMDQMDSKSDKTNDQQDFVRTILDAQLPKPKAPKKTNTKPRKIYEMPLDGSVMAQ